tara:strand:- start:1265 stop:2881 length:1617 start_codon:yes stop_codon:yes gene_type:complete
MKIAGFWSGHDCSFCILENGHPVVHAEYERYIREKEPLGDSINFLLEEYKEHDDIKHFVTCFPVKKITKYQESYQRAKQIVQKNDGKFYVFGHHQSHAANAFFSSNLEKALIITIDGGGHESEDYTTAFTAWRGIGNKIYPIASFSIDQVNFGAVWTRATRYIFNLQSGWPRGHQAGTVMAMAAVGDPNKYEKDFYRMLTTDLKLAMHKPAGQPKGANVGTDPKHPYLDRWAKIAKRSEQDAFDLAAGLQSATEKYLKDIIGQLIESEKDCKNICFSGGVVLNSVAMGKMFEWFPKIENIYVTPTPHDGGLTIGAAQYLWHHILENPRIKWEDNFTPYLGFTKNKVLETLKKYDNISHSNISDDKVIELLDEQNIVAVFGGGSESGRRALGNRSILADPRNPKMKEKINDKVKHRQWFRPFAPSILREEVSNWFETDKDSPYMNFVFKFKESVKDKVPAVVHLNGTARLQTVTKNDNEWYYNFIKKWYNKSNVPILLNTSFNDREPICETATHAINCFLKTDIDYLYFYDHKILVSKK